MSALGTIERISCKKKRVIELKSGEEIDAKHINVLLSKELQRNFDAE